MERPTIAVCCTCALIGLFSVGCGGVRPVIPELVVGAVYTRRSNASVMGPGRRGEALTLRFVLRIPTGPPPSPAEPLPGSRAERAGAPCLSPRLCAWERESRKRALRRLVHSAGGRAVSREEEP